ncbi:MAG: hypothetical protein LBU78_05270 [Microbacterium sp.]|nr:hypothetical protein [Microbacterium sp.]
MTSSRTLAALTAGLLALGLLAGCAPTPEPKPTKTAAFASDEEAFAAAEKTYEEYTKASNATDLSDPGTFDGVFAWQTGAAEASSRKNYSAYYAEHIRRDGASTFDSFTPVSNTNDAVVAQLCVDVSNVELLNAEGRSVVPNDRPPRQAIEVKFVPAKTSTGLAISSNTRAESLKC